MADQTTNDGDDDNDGMGSVRLLEPLLLANWRLEEG